ncbi:MAG: methyltransferase domain-containing protein [Bacteroidetes bacterium]|nr:methyltransferase domain-containing protein [Bacteroidota bacterium]
MKEQNAYILGTDAEELHRLGVQHQVWAEEAQKGWNLAQFKAGDTLLDLGSGPGFCTKELAYIAGQEGKVIGVDLSANYIAHLNHIKELYHLNIEPILADFNEMKLQPNSLDGMYCRWAMAWLPNPDEILKNVYDALKPGATMVLHEYFEWTTHQVVPRKEHLSKAIAAAMQSFNNAPGQINIGRELPLMLTEMGMKIKGIRLMPKLATPKDVVWQWPKTFYYSYFPRLAEMGLLTFEEVQQAFADLEALEKVEAAIICCPIMVEVIAEK